MESKVMTTSWGAPVDDNQNSITAGPAGPILLQDTHLIDKLAHFDRERIPERVVHAKGAGAHGYFEVTADVTKYTKAKFLSRVGKRTPIFARFSTVGGEKGSSDLARDPRGFAVKHYTEEGIYDMTGNNTPIFFIRDPSKFPDFIHTQKRHPATNVPDANAVWDFASLRPETVHQFSFLFSDRGIPASYRQMNGYSSHTFKWVNKTGGAFWVKYHYKPECGVKSFTREEAEKVGDPDWATRDLYNHIASGKVAAWKVFVQVIPFEAAKTYKWNIFDVTKIVPHKDYPLIEFGRMVLNRNPKNYFAEVEQAAFSPGHLVPGIEPSLDRMLQGRLFSYPDTHRHRLGPNYLQIPINCPYTVRIRNHQRDSYMTVDQNQGDSVIYEPNSVPGSAGADKKFAAHKFGTTGLVGRHDYKHANDDYEQCRDFFLNVLSKAERGRLMDNLGHHMSGATLPVQRRMLKVFGKVHADYAAGVTAALRKYGSKI